MARSQFDKPFLKTRVLKTLTNVYFRAKKHFHKQFLCFSGRTNNRKYLNFIVMLKVTPRDHTVFLGKNPSRRVDQHELRLYQHDITFTLFFKFSRNLRKT